jgi:hypothetical protein
VRRYPIEPLMALTGKTQFALLEGRRVNSETWSNIRDRGFTPQMADKVACANGFHPSLVWPSWEQDEFDELSIPCKECGERFIPKRKGHVFHVVACAKRAQARDRYQNDPEYRAKRIAAVKAHDDATRRAKRLKKAQHHRENAERIRAEKRAYYAANTELVRERWAAYYAANREELNARKRARYRRQKDAAA